jgi:hypothetical protein
VAATRRLGVVGTLVWDHIRHPAHGEDGFEDWGGIAYSLSALSAAAGPEWEIIPLLKVGEDMAQRAAALLDTLPRVLREGVRVVPEASNRVHLEYLDAHRRLERLTGGVPGWTRRELLPHLRGLDALYVNFISGQELTLAEMQGVRTSYGGPIYADLHSLLLEEPHGGARRHRPLARYPDWVRCFDAVQLNREELATLAGAADPWDFATRELSPLALLTLVTQGPEGARGIAASGLPADPLAWPAVRQRAGGRSRLLQVPSVPPVEGDPTGCGDVWGGTLFARLLAGDGFETALSAAQRAAARNAARRGTSGLAGELSAGSAGASP